MPIQKLNKKPMPAKLGTVFAVKIQRNKNIVLLCFYFWKKIRDKYSRARAQELARARGEMRRGLLDTPSAI